MSMSNCDVELRDAADLQLEQALDVVVRYLLAAQLLHERLEAGAYRVLHALERLLGLDALVDALLDEDAVERARVEEVVELAEADLELALRERGEAVGVLLEYLRDGHHLRTPAVEDYRARREGLLAVRKRVERGDRLLLAFAGGELELDLNGVGREVVELADGDLLALDRVLDRLRDGVSRLAPGELRYHELVLVLLHDSRADLDLAETVLVFGNVHYAAELEVGVESERLLLDKVYLGLEKLDEVVRENRS